MVVFSKPPPRRPSMRWNTTSGAFTYGVQTLDGDWLDQPLETGTVLGFDYFGAQHGLVKWKPVFTRFLVPFNQQTGEAPEGADPCTVVPVLEPRNCVVFELMVASSYAKRAINGLLDHIGTTEEASRGLIPLVRWDGNTENTPSSGFGKGKVFFSPRLSIIRWTPRSPELFGAPLMSPPKPLPAIAFDVAMPVANNGEITTRVVAMRKPEASVAADLDDDIPF
jgi:hypothetical protein